MKCVWLIIWISLIASPSFAVDAPEFSFATTNEPPALEITIAPSKTKIHVGEWSVPVTVQIKNISKTNRTFYQMSCSWWQHWKSSLPEMPGLSSSACLKNGSVSITLKPGEFTHGERPGDPAGYHPSMFVRTMNANSKVTVRLGFTPINAVKLLEERRQTDEIVGQRKFSLSDIVKMEHLKTPTVIETGERTFWSNEVTFEVLPN